MSSSQSEEGTMFFTREKNAKSNQNRERCFFTCEKNDCRNIFYIAETTAVQSELEVTEVCEFRAKILAFYRRLQLTAPLLFECFTNIQREKFFSKNFSRKKVKNISEIGVE